MCFVNVSSSSTWLFTAAHPRITLGIGKLFNAISIEPGLLPLDLPLLRLMCFTELECFQALGSRYYESKPVHRQVHT